MKNYILFLTFIFFPWLVAAQQKASVSGYVTDAETGETLIGANIGLKNTDKGTTTNTSGYFSLPDLSQKSYTLVVSYIGYRIYEQEIHLHSDEKLRLNIELKPEDYQLDELIVESKSKDTEPIGVSKVTLDTEFIKQVPGLFQADVFRSLQMLPGIKAASDISSGLYIRGGSPDQTLILLDHTTVYNPSHFFGFFSTFNPDAIKDIQLYKGGYPAKYGGRLGSVLSLYSKAGNSNEFKGSTTLGMLASRVSMEGPIKNGSWLIAARRSTLEPILAVLDQSNKNLPEKFYFWDINGKLSYDADPDNKLSFTFYMGKDKLGFPFADDANINLDYGNQTISTMWTHIFSDEIFANFFLTGSHYFNFPSFNIGGTPFKRSNNIYDFSLEGDVEYTPHDRHNITAGFELGLLTFSLYDEFDKKENFSSRKQSQYGSVYLQDKWKISDRWTATPGIRINGFSKGEYSRIAPRLSLEYKPSDRIRLQAAYGRYHQFLTLSSNEAFTGFDAWMMTGKGVPPASGNQYVAGIKTIPFEGYSFNVEAYYRSMEHLFEPDPFLPDNAGLSYEDTFRFGHGYALGAEVLFERNIGPLTGLIGYTFSITQRKFPNFNEPLQGGEARFYPPKHDRRHDIKTVLNYEFNTRWSANLAFTFATGQAYTRPLGRTAAFNLPTTDFGKDQLVVGKVNASRLPPYHRLDISASRKGTFFGLGEAQWKIQVVNVYSRRNIWFYNYELDENPIGREPIRLLPILPTISYSIDF